MRARDAGFTLIEVLLAAALFATVALGALEGARQLLGASRHAAARALAYGTLERLVARLRSEARDATAIGIATGPPSGAGACVQIDFFTADAAGPRFWSYRAFPNHPATGVPPGDVLERVAGSAPLAACDPSLPGTPVLRGLRGIVAAPLVASALATHADPYLGGRDSPFVGPAVANVGVPLGVQGASAPLAGGNALVELRLATDDGARVVDLGPGVFPTGYTLALTYACDDRCTVGHDGATPKTITACALTGWQPGWSRIAGYVPVPRGDGSGIVDLVPTYWIAGWFVFTYSGLAPDGSADAIAHFVLATNDGQTPADATHGAPAPFDAAPAIGAPGDPLAAWYARFAPYVDDAGPYDGDAAGLAGLARETRRCGNVDAEGRGGGFSFD